MWHMREEINKQECPSLASAASIPNDFPFQWLTAIGKLVSWSIANIPSAAPHLVFLLNPHRHTRQVGWAAGLEDGQGLHPKLSYPYEYVWAR